MAMDGGLNWIGTDNDSRAEGDRIIMPLFRDYGLCAANPFGERDFTGDKTRDGALSVPAGREVTFRYRVILHAGLDAAAIERLYRQFAGVARSPRARASGELTGRPL
jgi:hypothetical protein